MPLHNRVTPLSEIVADPARGLVYGNRGCLHDEHGTIRRRYNGKRWIACRLEFRGWKRERLLQPGRFTELFFLDEATAFAAGHRPCALCRHEDYRKFVTLWHNLHPGDSAGADTLDARLHAERIDIGSRGQRHSTAASVGADPGDRLKPVAAQRTGPRVTAQRPSPCSQRHSPTRSNNGVLTGADAPAPPRTPPRARTPSRSETV